MNHSRRLRASPLALLALVSLVTTVKAYWGWAQPTDWPVERLIENLERQLAERPGDVDLHYNLGRVHSYAFAFETEVLGTVVGSNPASLAERGAQESYYGRVPGSGRGTGRRTHLSPEETLRHLRGAIEHHLRAIASAPDRAELYLGLAYVLDHGRHLANRLDSAPIFGLPPASLLTAENAPEVLGILQPIENLGRKEENWRMAAFRGLIAPERLERSIPYLDRERNSSNADRADLVRQLLERYWVERAIAAYKRAHELAITTDLAQSTWVIRDLIESMTSHEAGEGFLRLTAERGLTKDEETFAEKVRANLKDLEELPSFITPIVLSLRPTASLAELLFDTAVTFDLDGDLEPELWPWVKPDTGLLVWDPERRGTITSGRSLFGSASGWFFFPDGYRVMAALDDDGDGWLRERELAGIGVWFDRDTDGVSDAGEVAPVEELGIAGLETRATGRDGLSLVNPRGLELADGRRLPTYDWVTAPAPVP
jgi:hypothetical protein